MIKAGKMSLIVTVLKEPLFLAIPLVRQLVDRVGVWLQIISHVGGGSGSPKDGE